MNERTAPKIDNAPGLVLSPRKDGWAAMWRARRDLVSRGYEPKNQIISVIGSDPTQAERDYISDRCNRCQDEMLTWGRGGLPSIGAYDATLRALILCYQNDPDSRFQKSRYRTRINKGLLCKRIDRDHGDEKIADIKARTLLRWHDEWSAGGEHLPMAHGMMSVLRTMFGFGMTMLECDECERLCGVMHHMKFSMGAKRKERLTAEQAIAIRAKAHKVDKPSIALAQAVQFDLMWRQKDVIGEIIPISEPGLSVKILGNEKWVRGLDWSEIDAELIVRHVTSKKNKDYEADLKLAEMVMEELTRAYPGLVTTDPATQKVTVHRELMPASGPVIRSEKTGEPYTDHRFRRDWREIATAAGVPKHVFNMDSRAGGVTEADAAGASIDDIRQAATHQNVSMTYHYSRGQRTKTDNVLSIRAAFRNQNKGGTK